ncbi:MAG TPA: prolyl oligopeptidase family serine peptidase [Pirellulales bacterium]
MSEPNVAPFGSWQSPITSDLIVQALIVLGDALLDQDDVYWIEGRPQEAGRHVLVRRRADGSLSDATPPVPFNARTRVHEYGGGAVVVADGVVYSSHFADQRLYRIAPGREPFPLTPAPAGGDPDAGLRYADGLIDSQRQLWIGVREDHRDASRQAVNTLVAVDLTLGGEGVVLVSGNDFYSSPRLSPDGRRLAWMTWNHPHMPWTESELWVGDFDGEKITNATRVPATPGESVFQPEWNSDGRLYFVSDRSGWWNIHRWDESTGVVVNVCPREAEFGQAQWVFRLSTYAFLSPSQAVCTYLEDGLGKLATLDLETGSLAPFDKLEYTEFASLRALGGKVAFRAGGPVAPAAIVLLDPQSGETTVLRQATSFPVDSPVLRCLTTPRPVRFPTGDGTTFAFGLYYPPFHPDYSAPEGDRPPLVVKCHGGPTTAASRTLDLRTQFWTSRGIAVIDVDYGGSTGYGREFRHRLAGQWGIVDVQDCAAAARYCAKEEGVDPHRVVITGGSAGGYTTLACLTAEDPEIRAVFQSGGSHYGVSDPAALAEDTHKFESQYLDWLIAPYTVSDPEKQAANRAIYTARAPIHHADRLSVPVTFFQGTEDKIVPPNQTDVMVEAVRAKGLPAQYLLFAGEQHGFRQAANIKRALDAELAFYATLIFKIGLRF